MGISGPDAVLRNLLSGSGIRYSGAETFGGLTVIPLLLKHPPAEREYLLLEEAVAAGTIVVDEVGGGVVARLLVHNLGERPVLLIDGEQLIGAKQNRILNTTILVAARSKLEIPVACVEQGRWGRSLGAMSPAETLFPEARRAKAEAVTRSVRLSGVYEADQSLVWEQVAHRLRTIGVQSPTSAILDAYRQRDTDLEAYARAFTWRDGQAGVICGIGGAVACADLFDHPETLRRLYPRLIRSYALDALGIERGEVDSTAGQRFLEAASRATMTVHPAVGLGEEVRLTGEGVTGSALVAEGSVVHLALFPAVRGPAAEPTAPPSRRRRFR
ncbi:MAG: ARPP-1 family domain-containing protein [Candidatus Methylomirabilaceae bacterium]